MIIFPGTQKMPDIARAALILRGVLFQVPAHGDQAYPCRLFGTNIIGGGTGYRVAGNQYFPGAVQCRQGALDTGRSSLDNCPIFKKRGRLLPNLAGRISQVKAFDRYAAGFADEQSIFQLFFDCKSLLRRGDQN